MAHTMLLTTTYPDGYEVWYCPTCGRLMLLSWPPNYSKEVLVNGDEMAGHTGGKGGVVMGIPKVVQDDGLPDDDWVRDND